jgi:hypothetical protein
MPQVELCVIDATATHPGHYAWTWRCDGGRQSSRSFSYFHDCVADAQQNGCAVDLDRTIRALRHLPAGSERDPTRRSTG